MFSGITLSVAAWLVVSLSCVMSDDSSSECFPGDCLAILQVAKLKGKSVCSGVYTIKPDYLPAFEVYCDMETDGGGWTVFQRRMDGSQDFYIYWKNYQQGFGNLEKEFWLGLDFMQRLTVQNSQLRVDMEDFDGNKKYAEYEQFRVGNAETKYKLTVTGYTGDAGDSLALQNGMKFTTRDRDNDLRGSNCAVDFKGAWWYKACHHSNLNGLYLYGQHSSFANGVNWLGFKGYHYSLKVTEMKLRRT